MSEKQQSLTNSQTLPAFTRRWSDWFGALFLGQSMARTFVVSDDVESAKQGALPSAFVEIPSGNATRQRIIADVVLPPRFFLNRKVTLPAGAKRNAEQVARLDMIRRTPFQPQDVHTVLSRVHREGEGYQASQLVIERDIVQQYKNNLATHGYRLRRLYTDGPDFTQPIADFSRDVAPRRTFWLSLNAILAMVAIAAFGIAFAQPVLRTQQATAAVKADIVGLQNEALALRQRIDALRASEAEKTAFLDILRHSPKLGDTLRELTVAMPDEAWAENMTFQQGRLVVSGQTTGSAAGLVLDLADARSFTNPRLSGATARTASGQERFEISLDLQQVN